MFEDGNGDNVTKLSFPKGILAGISIQPTLLFTFYNIKYFYHQVSKIYIMFTI